MAKYQLPCSCGNILPVDVSQAGQRLRCACGAMVEVPTMRGIRELAPVADAESTRPRHGGDWNQTRGLVFGAGLIALLVGIATTAYSYKQLGQVREVVTHFETLEATNDAWLDEASPTEVWDTWQEILTHGLGPREPNAAVIGDRVQGWMRQLMILGICSLVLGVAAIVGALAYPTRRAAPG